MEKMLEIIETKSNANLACGSSLKQNSQSQHNVNNFLKVFLDKGCIRLYITGASCYDYT